MKTSIALAFLIFAAATVSAEPVKVGSFTFAAPKGWKTVAPSSPMRKAQLEIAKGSDKAEVAFFQFEAGQGGSAADNVTRWFAQFPGSEAKHITENVQSGSVKITYVMTEGTFDSGMPGGTATPKPGYGLCGAILETTSGNVFIKMTGPNEIVKSATAAFKKMVSDAVKETKPQA